VRLTIGQFIGLVLLLAGLWFAYEYWWKGQDRTSWINRMHNNALESEREMQEQEAPPEPAKEDWI
jgi:hypothetical protein